MKDLLQLLSNEQIIGIAIAGIGLLIQIIYYFRIYLRPVFWNNKNLSSTQEPVSVIICARNEAKNLAAFLPLILEQDYPDFEVIVVNDCSEDDSEMILAQFSINYKNLKYTNIEPDKKFHHGKKLALTIGMKAAKNELLVFTDADCYPVSNKWLQEISKAYTHKKQIVLGYGGYETKKGLVNKLIRFDTLFIAMQYLGFALSGRPYMGVGRNLSYVKTLFFKGVGFSKHYHLISGDDDLFINDNANKNNTAVVISAESFTRSIPQTSFVNWAKQKKRHLTTGKLYKFGNKFFLSLEPFSRFIFYAGIIALIVLYVPPIITAAIFAFRLLIQLMIMKLVMNKLKEKGFWLLIPVFDIILPIIHLFFIISNILKNSKSRWK